jgi:hypothetical protein
MAEQSGIPGALIRHSCRKAGSKECERFGKIGDHFIRWSARFGMARPDENAEANPGRRAGFDVAHSIPENRAASRIKREIRDGLQKQAGLGPSRSRKSTPLCMSSHRVCA